MGKSGLTDGLCKRVDEYLERYELCKVKVLDTSPDGLADVAAELSERLGAKVVLTIGRVATLERSRLVEGGKRRGGGARQKASRVDPKIWSKDVLWSVHLPFERFAEVRAVAHARGRVREAPHHPRSGVRAPCELTRALSPPLSPPPRRPTLSPTRSRTPAR